jgi:hypothetical protein
MMPRSSSGDVTDQFPLTSTSALGNRRVFSSQSKSKEQRHAEEEAAIAPLLDNNRQWAANLAEKEDYRAALLEPQKPKYLYFGCSDSRLPANQILGLG